MNRNRSQSQLPFNSTRLVNSNYPDVRYLKYFTESKIVFVWNLPGIKKLQRVRNLKKNIIKHQTIYIYHLNSKSTQLELFP